MALDCCSWQEPLKDALLQMRGSLPNAVLIYGPRGAGTVEVVISFVKSLFCEHPDVDGSPCGSCQGCRLADAYTHPDIAYVMNEVESLLRHIPYTEPDSAKKDRKLFKEILISQTRSLTDFLNLSAHGASGRRAVVVYPADTLRVDAASALLKNLEEPPENTVFFLVADDIDRVLPTIRSRCRLLRAPGADFASAVRFLSRQGVPHPEEALRSASGQPFSVLYERALEADDSLDKKTRDELLTLGALTGAARGDLLGALSAGGSMPLQRIFIKDAKGAIPVSAFVSVLLEWAYDLARCAKGLEPHYFPEYADALKDVAAMAKPEALYDWADSLKGIRALASHPLSAQLVLEQALIRYRRIASGKSFQ